MPRTRAVCWQTRRRAERALGTCLVAGCVAAPALAGEVWAADPVRVAIVDDGSAELSRKLGAEASYAGFGVNEGSGDILLDGSLAARIRVLSRERVELALLGPGGTSERREVLAQAPGEADAFALRVMEHLRARLVDLGWSLPSAPANASPAASGARQTDAEPSGSAAQRQGDLLPQPASTRGAAAAEGIDAAGHEPPAPASKTPLLWLGAGAAASRAAGGLGLVPHAVLGVRAEPSPAWGLSLEAFVPLLAGEIDGGEGSARSRWYAVVVGVDVSLLRSAPWFASVGIGGGLLLLDVSAEGRAGFTARDDRLYAGAAQLQLSAGWHVLERLRLRASAHGGLSAPRPVLRFDGQEVASLGRAYGGVGLALEGALGLGAESAP